MLFSRKCHASRDYVTKKVQRSHIRNRPPFLPLTFYCDRRLEDDEVLMSVAVSRAHLAAPLGTGGASAPVAPLLNQVIAQASHVSTCRVSTSLSELRAELYRAQHKRKHITTKAPAQPGRPHPGPQQVWPPSSLSRTQEAPSY